MVSIASSSIVLICAFILIALNDARSANHLVEFTNDGNEEVVIDWQDPHTGKTIEFFHLQPGKSMPVNSYANHTFILRMSNDTCEDVCRSSVITISDNDDQVVKVKPGLAVEHLDSTTKQRSETEFVHDCRDEAKLSLASGTHPDLVTQKMLECVESATARLMENINEDQVFEEKLLRTISSLTENYTCADPDLDTSGPVKVKGWTHHNVTRRVNVLHERRASKIHAIENFISDEECDAIQKAAEPQLHWGTVADGKGGHKLSDHRKAKQAGVAVPWELEAEGNPIARVMRRLYDYTNDATGFGIDVVGQEDIMSIQYFGRGDDDAAPDRYMPHCDGDCSGLPLKRGGRVATMVMYCDEPIRGGGTNFQNAGVFVKPKKGTAAFFSYLDPETHVHETGFTTHSGCPVVEGVKRIAVHWMRIGVDKENPWDSFNTLTMKKSDCEDD